MKGPELNDPKKDQIINAAADLFIGEGFPNTSMDMIANRSGISKATIYTRFDSKEDLFEDVIAYLCAGIEGPSLGALDRDNVVLEDVLTAVGKAALYRMLQPRTMAAIQMVAGAYPKNPGVARIFWENGPANGQRYVLEALTILGRDGRFADHDLQELAERFICLIFGPHFVKQLLGVSPPPERQEIDRWLAYTVRHFVSDLENGTLPA